MKKILSILPVMILLFLINSSKVSAQKALSEGSFVYDIMIQSKDAKAKSTSALNGAKTIVYLKGGLSRTEMTSALGNETTIYNSKLGNAVILKEYSGQKLMITLNKDNWLERNKKFDGITFENTSETKVINGYNCKKAFAKLKDGSSISVYYTPDITLLNKDFNLAFKNLPGFPVEYEFETERTTFKYTLGEIDFNPVAAAKFDFPKAGYRVMTYDENKKVKSEE
jgi:GLPGLI family protein